MSPYSRCNRQGLYAGLPPLPDDWTESPLGDLVDTNPETLGTATPGDFAFRYIDLSSVTEGIINWETVHETNFRAAPSRARRCVRQHDVLFGTVRPSLRSHAAIGLVDGGPLVASTGFAVLRAGTKSCSGYIKHLIFSDAVGIQVRRLETGSNYPAVNESDLTRVLVPHPHEAEQARIAEVLDTLEEAIRRTEQVIGKSMSVRQGLLQDLLTLGINENGELRDSHRESFSPSPIGSIPSTWRARQVGSLLQGIEQGWSPDCEAEPAELGAWGVLKTTAVVWDGYQDHENKALPSHLRPRPELEVRCGDVLMTRGGPNSRVGVVAQVEFTQGRLMLSDKVYRLVPKDEIGNAFLALALSGSRTQMHLSRLKTGLAESQTNISQAIVRALLIPLPPVEEQERIVTRYSATVKRITEDQGLLNRLRALKAGLASDLLTGHVRVTTGAPA